MHHSIRRYSEVFDFIQVAWLKLSYCCSCLVYLRLNSRKFLFDHLLAADNNLFVFVATTLQCFDFLLTFSFLLHRYLNLRHCYFCLLLFNGKQLRLCICFSWQLIHSNLSLLKFLQSSNQMLCLASTCVDDLGEDVFEAVHEVDELLGTWAEYFSCPCVQIDCSSNDLLLFLVQQALSLLQLSLSNLLQRLLRPAIIPNDHTFIEQCWILRAITLEVWMCVVQTDHNRQVLFDSGNKELKESGTLILILHVVLELL